MSMHNIEELYILQQIAVYACIWQRPEVNQLNVLHMAVNDRRAPYHALQ